MFVRLAKRNQQDLARFLDCFNKKCFITLVGYEMIKANEARIQPYRIQRTLME